MFVYLFVSAWKKGANMPYLVVVHIFKPALMDCRICDLKQRQFLCETCLKTHIHDLRQQAQYYATDRDEQVAKSTKVLAELIAPGRAIRARFFTLQSQVEDMQKGLAKLRKENTQKRDQLQALRETLASRRRNLSAAKLQTPVNVHPIASPTPREAESLSALSATISRARAGLVQELIEVFNVVEVGGRPPIGGKAGTKGEWTIGDLILPVPGDIRRYPPDHINAVLTHTVHFLSLLTFYLGIKLPFEVIWSGGKLGVGQPRIGAIKGTETGGWARWYSTHPLYLSSSERPPSSFIPPAPSSDRRSPSTAKLPESHQLNASFLASNPPPSAPQSSFTTALAMLLYNVSYLSYTQNVEVPLSQAGDVLSNLWMVCCSSDLGRKSHETYPHLPAPTPPSFPLDFSQLLQATVANPPSKGKTRGAGITRNTSYSRAVVGNSPLEEESVEGEEGWDLVDDDV